MSQPRFPSEQPSLSGHGVSLEPLQHTHASDLVAAAADGQLWDMKITIVPGPETVAAYIDAALEMRRAGTAWPFVIRRGSDARIVGSTRLWKMSAEHRKLEIGYTWLSLSAQRTAVNTACKYLLLRHSFESLGCVRVQLTTDELNERSRAAIARLGAKQEGILRKERIMPDGRRRNSVRFSIIDDEWPAVKAQLEQRLTRE